MSAATFALQLNVTLLSYVEATEFPSLKQIARQRTLAYLRSLALPTEPQTSLSVYKTAYIAPV